MKAAAITAHRETPRADYLHGRSTGYLPVRRLELRAMLGVTGPLQGRDVLDLTCGSGWYGRQLLGHGARRVLGIDGCASMIDEARRLSAQCADRMAFQCMDAMEFECAEGFDIVLAAWWLCRASSPAQLAAMYCKAAQLLRPGGWFVAVCNNPDYRIALGDNSEYGVRALSQQDVDGGQEITVAFDHEGSERARDRQWPAAEHFRCAASAGLHGVQMHLPLPQDDDLARGGAAFWKSQLANPISMVLLAQR